MKIQNQWLELVMAEWNVLQQEVDLLQVCPTTSSADGRKRVFSGQSAQQAGEITR
jgi:hypothetical protein